MPKESAKKPSLKARYRQRTPPSPLADTSDVFQFLFLCSGDAQLLLEDGVVIDCNDVAIVMTKAESKDQIVGHSPAFFSPPKQWDGKPSEDKAQELMTLALTKGFVGFEWSHQCFDGSLLPVEIMLTAVPFRGRKLLHASWRDISARRQAEVALRESEARYRATFHDTLEALSLSYQGRIVDVNFQWLHLHGYTDRNEVIGLDLADIIHPDDRVHFLERRNETYKPVEKRLFDLRDCRKDGSCFHVEVQSNSIIIDGKSMVLAAVRDVSDRKQAEEKVRTSIRKLAALHEVIMAAASTPEFDLALARSLDAIRRTLDVENLNFVIPSLSGDYLVLLESSLDRGNKPDDLRIPLENSVCGRAYVTGQTMLIPDVTQVPFYLDVFPRIRSELAVPVKVGERVLAVLDVESSQIDAFSADDLGLFETMAAQLAVVLETANLYEAERAQRRLVEQSQAQLVQSEKLAATGRLAASLAHEINNPLQAIQNSMRLILDHELENDEQDEYLRLANDEVERLIGLSGRILGFARRATGEVRAIDINDVIKKTLALAGKFLQHRQVALRLDLAAQPLSVSSNPGELDQVFLNLLVNAVEAMPQGGTVSFTSRIEGGSGCITVEVTDTGCGMSDEQIEHAFEPFYSTKEWGTGLGLSVTSDVIKRHRGKISVTSQIGKGSTFVVRIPVLGSNRDLTVRIADKYERGLG